MSVDRLKLQNLETLSSDGLLKGAKYYKFISEMMGDIHSKIPKQSYDISKVATSTDIREENFNGHNYKRATMFLLTNGCEWALKNGNGCTICGHLAKQTGGDVIISENDYISQFANEFNTIDFTKSPLLSLYNNGSFLNNNEIPQEARYRILRKISENPSIKMLVLETRPEFVNTQVIDEICSLIPNKHVEIAIGLEILDDFLRSICINKGFSITQYNEAAKIITSKLNLRTYVMLKPPFLNEKEGIENAVNTIEHAFGMGSTTVSLEACTIQDFTLTKYLSEMNLYKTTWLWSIIEVVKRTAHLGKLIVGLFQFYPSPNIVPYNCDKCSYRALEAIRTYNRELDVRVFDDLNCDCKNQWKEELNKESMSIDERINTMWEKYKKNIEDNQK